MSLFLFADLVSKKLGVIPEGGKKDQDDDKQEERGKLLKYDSDDCPVQVWLNLNELTPRRRNKLNSVIGHFTNTL